MSSNFLSKSKSNPKIGNLKYGLITIRKKAILNCCLKQKKYYNILPIYIYKS